MRVLREVRVHIAANRDDLDLEPRDGRQYAQQFFGFAARTEREDHIAIRDHSQIAMQGIERIEHDGGRTGAGKSGGNFAADMT